MPSLRIGLIGPDRTQPCGIADYTSRLAAALAGKCDLAFVPFRDAFADSRLAGCSGILVQYERSLMPPPTREGDFLAALSARHPDRVFVVPHEVYDRDPFAFPYAGLRSRFPPLLWLKRLRYLRLHRDYAAEKRLQARGYGAHRVIPLSGPGAEILRGVAGDKVLDPVPHAFYAPPESGEAQGGTPGRDAFFPVPPKALLGIFGFLNPGLDYGAALDLLAGLDPGVCLLILGGPRGEKAGEVGLDREVAARGLQARVRVTGYLPEAGLAAHLRLCDAFLCPMRFKSNSGSLLHLLHLGRPIIVSDLPLTRYLRDQGAPLQLYAGPGEMRMQVEAALSGAAPAQANRYPWDFDAVAEAYLRILGAQRS